MTYIPTFDALLIGRGLILSPQVIKTSGPLFEKNAPERWRIATLDKSLIKVCTSTGRQMYFPAAQGQVFIPYSAPAAPGICIFRCTITHMAFTFFSSKARAAATPIYFIFMLESAGATKRLPRVLLGFFFIFPYLSLARRFRITPFIIRGEAGKIKSRVPLRDIFHAFAI